MLKLPCSSFPPLRIHPESVAGQGWLWGTVHEVKGLNKLSTAMPSRVEAALSLATVLPDQHSPSQGDVSPRDFPPGQRLLMLGLPGSAQPFPGAYAAPLFQCSRATGMLTHIFGVSACCVPLAFCCARDILAVPQPRWCTARFQRELSRGGPALQWVCTVPPSRALVLFWFSKHCHEINRS